MDELDFLEGPAAAVDMPVAVDLPVALKSYPKSSKTYYASPFWWNPKEPWYVEYTRLKSSNGHPLRKRFATHDEAKAFLEANLILLRKKGVVFDRCSTYAEAKNCIDYFSTCDRYKAACEKGLNIKVPFLEHIHEIKCDQVYNPFYFL